MSDLIYLGNMLHVEKKHRVSLTIPSCTKLQAC